MNWKFLKDELGKTNYLKKEEGESFHVNYFIAKENSYHGAKKENKETIKKLWKILKKWRKNTWSLSVVISSMN